MSSSTFRRGKSVVYSLLACALVAPVVYAWAPAKVPAPTVAASPAKAPPTPLLWKVSDQDNSIYLLGSFHLLKADDYPLSPDIDAVFAEAENLVFEVPPSQLTDPLLAQKMQEMAGFSEGGSLSQVLPPDVREKMGQVLGKDRLAQMEAMEPWFINLGLLIGISQQMGFKADQGLDLHIARMAEAANKPVSGLETAEEQLAVLDASPMDEQIAGLRDFFNKPGEVPKLLNETHDAWRTANVAKLNSLVIDEVRKETPVTYRIINVERNDAWVPKLQQMLDGAAAGNDTLVVVGAMHLIGEDGVVEKLRAKGYQVERICSACK
jgi:uncharacterized protein YbaP (TraB family)